MPVLDWNATAAWLAIFATLAISIVTPAISTHLNNRFHLRLKELELKHTNESEMYSKKFAVYEGFLQNVGRFLHYMNRENNANMGTYLYELYLYLPSEHWPLLDSLTAAIGDQQWVNAQKTFIEISKILSSELKSSETSVELKK